MTVTISAQDAITAVHDAAMLGGNNGLHVASIAAMTGMPVADAEAALLLGAARGIVSRIGGRWVAWDICRTCGYGTRDVDGRFLTDFHPSPDACEMGPGDYCVGYPLTGPRG